MDEGRKAVLIVLFIPSVERDGITSIDQDSWVEKALVFFGPRCGATRFTGTAAPTLIVPAKQIVAGST